MIVNAAKMSLPVNSDYLSLERIARYRHACTSGSPYSTNKPIDIKPRRRGYADSLELQLLEGGKAKGVSVKGPSVTSTVLLS